MLPEQKKKPRKHRVFKALMAEAVGFEPTCPCGQLHFECSSLQPLRYASVYKYSLLGTNHMISSQPRYDHFDTSPDIAVPLFRETGGFCGSCRTTGLLYHKTPGYARAKSKKFLFRAKSAAEGYIRGGEGAAERKHLTKAVLCDIIMS